MIISHRALNPSALAVEEAETKIRILIQDYLFRGATAATTFLRSSKVISECVAEVIEPLKTVTKISLIDFYNSQMNIARQLPYHSIIILNALAQVADKTNAERAKDVLLRNGYKVDNGTVYNVGGDYVPQRTGSYGVPVKEFHEDYYKERVRPTLDRLAKDEAKDSDDVSGRNSLRNRAEMEVRYQNHLQSLESFRADGVKLVIASTHADCSERCRQWQGKVYSLDGTSGITDDGRRYQPIENATDVFYTTKAGKTYKNGLLGFNCRHYLVEYKRGLMFTKQSEAEEARQYDITLRQREFEREIRRKKIEAVTYKYSDKNKYLKALRKSKELTKAYVKYSKDNNRAYYKSRIRIT